MSDALHPGSAPVRTGDVLAGKYVVERVIGVGGMGVVVAARHQLLGGRVALKFVLPALFQGDAAAQRFLREAQAATLITSEHVARVSDVGMLDHGAPYMVMEFLEGRDLGSLLAEQGPLELGMAVDYLLQALQAVAEAHAKGIVHRDLKPSNLFLTRRADGSALVKVLDFGIAKAIVTEAGGARFDSNLTATQGLLGSPLYMSPEQIRSPKHVDARSDVWAVGVLLHELLSRQYPFTGDSAPALLAAISADPAIPLRRHRPDAPALVEDLILACLEKDRDRRVPSVAVIAEALAGFGSDDARLSLARIRGVAGHVANVSFRRSEPERTGASGAPAVTGGASWGGTIGEPSGTRAPKRTAVALTAGAAALLVAGGGWLMLRPREGTTPEPVNVPSVAAPSAPSSAVMPAVTATPPAVTATSPAVTATSPAATATSPAVTATSPAVTATSPAATATASAHPVARRPAVTPPKTPAVARPAPKKADDIDDLIGERR